jgi:hypothetical protein
MPGIFEIEKKVQLLVAIICKVNTMKERRYRECTGVVAVVTAVKRGFIDDRDDLIW